jgi:hypothetical protein
VIRLTRSVASTSKHLDAQISIRRIDRSSWVLSLATVFDGITGERTLSAASCKSLAEAAVLTLALILNPQLTSMVSAPAVDQPPRLQRPALETSPPRSTGTVSESDGTLHPVGQGGSRPVWQVGAHAGLVEGVIRNASSWFSVSLGIVLGRVSVRLVPSVAPPQDLFLATEPRVGGRVWAASLSGLGCWALIIRLRLALNACAGLDATRLDGHGLGVLHPRDARVYWNAGELAAIVEFHLARGFLVELGATGLVPLSRPAVYLEGIGQVSRPAILGLSASGGLTLRFE